MPPPKNMNLNNGSQMMVCIANQTGTDLTTAMRANLKKKTARDKTRHKENPKLKKRSRQATR